TTRRLRARPRQFRLVSLSVGSCRFVLIYAGLLTCQVSTAKPILDERLRVAEATDDVMGVGQLIDGMGGGQPDHGHRCSPGRFDSSGASSMTKQRSVGVRRSSAARR